MKIIGKNITEVWDYRLSNAVPIIDRSSGTWVVQIFSKTNPDYDPDDPETIAKPLQIHDTGIPATVNDEYDVKKLIPCYNWLKSVRDDYSLDDIEERKPFVKKINEANAALAKLGSTS